MASTCNDKDLDMVEYKGHNGFCIANTFLFNCTVKYKTITKLFFIHKCTKFKIILHILAINKKIFVQSSLIQYKNMNVSYK